MHVSTAHTHTAGSHSAGGMRSLSGGERAFTTTAFLLSLWQFSETPVRAMDEPDAQCDETTQKAMLQTFLARRVPARSTIGAATDMI